jgi:hypothetical protein
MSSATSALFSIVAVVVAQAASQLPATIAPDHSGGISARQTVARKACPASAREHFLYLILL